MKPSEMIADWRERGLVKEHQPEPGEDSPYWVVKDEDYYALFSVDSEYTVVTMFERKAKS